MKTKTFFLLCLFMGFGLIKLSAQPDNKKGNGTIEYTGEFIYWQPVYCDGKEPDMLYGLTIYDGVEHYKDGMVIWQYFHNIGEATSTITGEIFEVKETDKQYPEPLSSVVWHFNLVGNQGSHYLGSMTWNSAGITIDKFVCVDNAME